MGAGAGKEVPPFEESSTSLNSDIMSCETCSSNFNIINRKKPCTDCGKDNCGSCLTKQSVGKVTQRRCKNCLLLTSGNFTRTDLMSLPTKDLRSFIIRRKMPMNNCTEKTDLVELLLSTSNNTHYRQEQADKQRRLHELEMRKRQRDLESAHWGHARSRPRQSDTEPPSQPQTTTPADPPTQSQDPPPEPQSGQNSQRTEPEGSVDPDPPPPPSASEQNTGADNTGANNTGANNTVSDNTGSDNTGADNTGSDNTGADNTGADNTGATGSDETNEQHMHSVENSPRVRARKLTRLKDVNEVQDIEDLTVRQLKEILATNYVVYKGCCEKWELIDRVKRLWVDNQKNLEKANEIEAAGEDVSTSAENELCKICMDAVIDCVLLDCGHMVACTQCGKQMSECPVCRQFVVRVVHVFKA